jgi:putative Mn2+ efflux pump MntP
VLTLHPDWQRILKTAWSVRFMALAAVLSGVATGLTIAQPYLGINPLSVAGVVGLLTTVSAVIGIYARIVKQQGID